MSFVDPNRLTSRLIIFVVIILLPISSTSWAQGSNNLEDKVKIAYLYNFTKFIVWPENNNSTFNLCVIGDTPINTIISSLESKSVLEKPIRIRFYETVQQVADCQIAYFEHFDTLNSIQIGAILQAPQLSRTLTVSSQEGFAENGGMIGFVLAQEKVKLHINLQSIKRQGLTVSAKLLEVAVLVTGGGDE